MPDPLNLTDRLKKEWFVIKGAPFSFASCCIIIAIILWGGIYWHYSGIIESDQAQIEGLKTSLNNVQKQNGTEAPMSLKARVEILSHQLYEFSIDFRERNTNGPAIRIPDWNKEYLTNFLERIEKVRVELEKSGQNTDNLAKLLANPDVGPDVTFNLAEELQKLSGNLKN